MAIGGYQKGATQRKEMPAEGEGATVYFDMELGLNAMLLRRWVAGRECELKIAGGVGTSTDTAYVYGSARLALELIPGKVAAEGQYTYRWGDSFSDAASKEHRLGGHLVFPGAGLDLGAELWLGDQRLLASDMATGVEVEQPTGSRGMKGKYTVLMLSLGYSWW
jgi:hypothetical protein